MNRTARREGTWSEVVYLLRLRSKCIRKRAEGLEDGILQAELLLYSEMCYRVSERLRIKLSSRGRRRL